MEIGGFTYVHVILYNMDLLASFPVLHTIAIVTCSASSATYTANGDSYGVSVDSCGAGGGDEWFTVNCECTSACTFQLELAGSWSHSTTDRAAAATRIPK